MSSLTVSVSVKKSKGVTVCWWLRSELLTVVTCLPLLVCDTVQFYRHVSGL